MKISTVLLIGALFSTASAFASNIEAKVNHKLKGHIAINASVVTLNKRIGDIHNINNLDLGYKITIKDNINKVFYGDIDAIKYNGNHLGYGLTMGAHQAHGMFRPFAEVSYNNNPFIKKMFTKKQFGYDGGVEVYYFRRLSSYIKYHDFADTNKKAIIVGVNFNINHKFSVFANYQFKAKDTGTSAEFGVGYLFS